MDNIQLYVQGVKVLDSRTLKAFLEVFSTHLPNGNLSCCRFSQVMCQILHMDAGDTLELRLQPFSMDAVDILELGMANSLNIHDITLNIELTGFDYLV